MNHSPPLTEPIDPRDGLDIAIVGMAGRFPGAPDLDAFWRNLCGGVESVSSLSPEELLESGVERMIVERPNYVRARAVLEDIDLFDAPFFNMTPKEAEITDPQQRLLLECAWETLEHAGYDPYQYKGSIGVYAGSSTSGYLFNLFPHRVLLQSPAEMSAMLGVEKDSLATRLSYKLNLQGPSLAVQTACSTSLVAVHLACQALLSGECEMALAGGVSVTVPQKVGYLYQEGGIVSPDGHCRTFDAKAEGTVGGSGVGLVLLKRLQEAMDDGDHILAVVKGSSVNNDGASKVGYTAPSVEGQAQVIKAAHIAAGIEAESISYIEAHGTGTPMGDPIEVAALTQAFRTSTARKGFCAIGSVKTNIGHLDAAAGIAGLIKTVLALSHRQIPPSLHYVRPNPSIEFSATPFYVNTTLSEWKQGGTPRRAGVSSFGLGGTNAHVVLEEAPGVKDAATPPSDRWNVLVLSARSNAALERATNRLAACLRTQSDLDLEDVSHTLQSGRKAFAYRRWVAARTAGEAERALSQPITASETAGPVGEERRVAFMFSGQGSQYAQMGRSLYRQDKTFRRHVDHAASLLNRHLGRDIRAVLFPESAEDHDLIHRTAMTQPALFVLEYALARLWAAWGIAPHAMVGHSIGEYVAACLSGVFSLQDALAVVAMRGRLMQEMPAGSMLAVPLTEAETTPLLPAGLDVAAVNAPAQCVLSGPPELIDGFERDLAVKGIKGRRLKTSHAFHSSMMNPILERFESFLSGIPLQAPVIPWLSNVTGTWIQRDQATDPAYWSRHLRSTVRFSDGVRTLLEQPMSVLLEVGPGRTLQTLAQRHPGASGFPLFASLNGGRAAAPTQDEMAGVLTTLGALWGAGVRVDWAGLHAGRRPRLVALPTYPFERQRYWVEPSEVTHSSTKADRQADISKWFYQPSWKRSALAAKRAEPVDEHWVVFVSDQRTGEMLASGLGLPGRSVTAVSPGWRFERHGDGTYRVRPDSRKDHELLLRDLTGRDRFPSCLLHTWTIDQKQPEDDVVSRMQTAQEKGLLHLVILAQTFGHRRGDRLPILVLSQGLHDVAGEEILRPEQATLIGACRVIPQEYPGLFCRQIDLERTVADMPLSKACCDRLVAEASALDADPVVAYRGRYRWVQTFEPLLLEGGEARPSLLREGGHYLITGGLGGVGLCLAEYLTRTAHARVILTSRSSPDAEQRARLAALERSGASVLVLQADVADLTQMQAVLEQARGRFGEIHGVIHAAGIAGGGLLELNRAQGLWDEFRPKVVGALVLEKICRELSPDFLLFCSSLTAVVGGVGQGVYCAANAYLDAVAHAGRQRGLRAISVNFDRWRGIGMAIQAEDRLRALGVAEKELDGMTAQEGQDVLHRILHGPDLPQVVQSIRDLPTVAASVAQLSLSPAPSQVAGVTGRAPSASVVEAVGELLEGQVAEIWQQILGAERVRPEDDFFKLGGESLSALQILNRVQERYQVELSLREFFGAPTVAGLARQIRAIREAGRPQEAGIVPIPREARRLRGVSA